MPNSPAVRIITRADSVFVWWLSFRGFLRFLAQRPLPSMITATCRGREALASGLKCALGVVIPVARKLAIPCPRSKIKHGATAHRAHLEGVLPRRLARPQGRARWGTLCQ